MRAFPYPQRMLVLCAVMICSGESGAQDQISKARSDSAKKAVSSVLSSTQFGVPDSPAFALLKDAPLDVTHVATPTDFASHLSSWHDGTKLRAGIAFDTRPLIMTVGNLESYRQDWGRRLAFRSVLSAGTAKSATGTSDVLSVVGIRIPFADYADIRADTLELNKESDAYIKSKNASYEAGMKKLPLKDGAIDEDAIEKVKKVSDSVANVEVAKARNLYAASHWNAFRLDVGAAGNVVSRSGEASADSTNGQSAGVWGSTSVPVGDAGGPLQVTVSAKQLWQRADTAKGETGRRVVGARLKALGGATFSASIEGAFVWSTHSAAATANQRWQHLGVLAEWYVPELKGWISASYGGDMERTQNPGNRFALHYAIYKDRILSKEK